MLFAIVAEEAGVLVAKCSADFEFAQRLVLGDATEFEVGAETPRVFPDLGVGGALGLLHDGVGRTDKHGKVLRGGLRAAVVLRPPQGVVALVANRGPDGHALGDPLGDVAGNIFVGGLGLGQRGGDGPEFSGIVVQFDFPPFADDVVGRGNLARVESVFDRDLTFPRDAHLAADLGFDLGLGERGIGGGNPEQGLGLEQKRGGRGDVDAGDTLGNRAGIAAAGFDLRSFPVVDAEDECVVEGVDGKSPVLPFAGRVRERLEVEVDARSCGRKLSDLL